MKRHRSVLTRLERIRLLQEKGTLNAEESSLLGLPKVKHLKMRVRKEKAATPAAGTGATTAPAAGGTTAAPATPGASKPAAKAAGGSAKPEAGVSPKKKE